MYDCLFQLLFYEKNMGLWEKITFRDFSDNWQIIQNWNIANNKYSSFKAVSDICSSGILLGLNSADTKMVISNENEKFYIFIIFRLLLTVLENDTLEIWNVSDTIYIYVLKLIVLR